MEQKDKKEAVNYKVGDTFHLNKGLLPLYKCHVVGIVDEIMVVYRWYGRHKQWWHYSVDPSWLLDMMIPQAQELKRKLKK